jgi:NTE family protein
MGKAAINSALSIVSLAYMTRDTHITSAPRLAPVTLALGGGAALGWAHIGVVRLLQERGLPIAGVAGTSIGAVVGAALAAGKLDVLENLARSTNGLTVLRFLDLSFRPGGVLGGRAVEKELTRHFSGLSIEALPTPFASVAADLITGNEVVLRSGSLVEAVRASLAIPGVFTPVMRDGQILADGGLLNPVPVSAARLLSSAPVVAVNLQGDYLRRAEAAGLRVDATRSANVVKLSRASFGLLLTALTDLKMALHPADVTITPLIGHIDTGQFTKADELIQLGRAAAAAAWPQIAALAAPHPDMPKK